jgi:serine/threonine-protein kinase
VPPEVLKGGEWTPQSDLASLGYVLIELLSGQPDALVAESASEATTLNLPLDSASVDALDQPTRTKLAAAKESLPLRLRKLIPKRAAESETLITLCTRLTDPNPKNRFRSAEVAISESGGTHEFLAELEFGNLGTYWPHVLECWVTLVKAAEAQSPKTTHK